MEVAFPDKRPLDSTAANSPTHPSNSDWAPGDGIGIGNPTLPHRRIHQVRPRKGQSLARSARDRGL